MYCDRQREQAEKKRRFLLTEPSSKDVWDAKMSSFRKISPLTTNAENKENNNPNNGHDATVESATQAPDYCDIPEIAQPDEREEIQLAFNPEFNSTDFLEAALGGVDVVENDIQPSISVSASLTSILQEFIFDPLSTSTQNALVQTEDLLLCTSQLSDTSCSSDNTTATAIHTPSFSHGPSTSSSCSEAVVRTEPGGIYQTIREYRASKKALRRSVLPTPLPSPVKLMEPESTLEKATINMQLLDLLLDKASILQDQILQASKAVELCRTQEDFTASDELVEAERVLLVTILGREAVLDKVQALHLEGLEQEPGVAMERACVKLSNIVLYLKHNFVSANQSSGFDTWFVCVASHEEDVVATHAVSELQEDCLMFSDSLLVPNLRSDFTVRLEVYGLRLKRGKTARDTYRSLKRKVKAKKGSLFEKICVTWNLPGLVKGAEVVINSSAFKLCGGVILTCTDLGQDLSHSLSRVPLSSPLTKVMDVSMKTSALELFSHHEGFLNLLELHRGTLAWRLMWCRLVGHKLRYWNNSNVQADTPPTGEIDLRACVSGTISLAGRELCPRRNTLLVEVTRPGVAESDADDNIIVHKEQDHTVVRYFLNALSKNECKDWCMKLSHAATTLKTFQSR